MKLPVYLMIGQRETQAVQEAFPHAADASAAALDFCRTLWGSDRGPLPTRWEDAMAALARDGSPDWITVVRRDLDYAAGLYAAQAEQMASGVCEFAFAYCDSGELANLVVAEEGPIDSRRYDNALRAWMRMESQSLTEAMNDVIGANLPSVRALDGLVVLAGETKRRHTTISHCDVAEGDF